jgi:hypothetical protein
MKRQRHRYGTRLKSGHDEMKSCSKMITICLLPVLLLVFGNLRASPPDLDLAVQKYHAGNPEKAIAILKPLAIKGDMHAQNLLGNIVYALATTDPSSTSEDPLKWYRMAAAQGLPEASYALGVIYNNNWLKTRHEEDSMLAEFYYQQALDRGYGKAEAPLMKIAARNQASRKSNSREYSNSSFGIKWSSSAKPQEDSVNAPSQDAVVGFELSGDAIADSIRLEALLRQLNSGQAPISLTPNGSDWPDEATLIQMLTSFGASDSLASELAKLMGQLKAPN